MTIFIFGGYPRSTTRIALLLAARITTHFPRLKTETIVYLSHKPEWGYFPCTQELSWIRRHSIRFTPDARFGPSSDSLRYIGSLRIRSLARASIDKLIEAVQRIASFFKKEDVQIYLFEILI